MPTTIYTRNMARSFELEPADAGRIVSITDAWAPTWTVLASWECDPPGSQTNWHVGCQADVDIDTGRTGSVRLRTSAGVTSSVVTVTGPATLQMGVIPIPNTRHRVFLEGRQPAGSSGLRCSWAKLGHISAPMLSMIDPGVGAWPAPAITYDDPTTSREVIRVTRDGGDVGAINYMGGMSGEATSWSPDGTRAVFAKAVPGGGGTGIYMVDLIQQQVAPICTSGTAGQWAYPIFSHDGTEVYFIDGAGSAPNGNGNKAWAVRKAPVPSSPAWGSTTPPTGTTSLLFDLRAAAEANATFISNALVLGKNNWTAGDDPSWKYMNVHVEWGGGARTLLFQPTNNSPLGGNWSYSQLHNGAGGDGDVSIWAPAGSSGHQFRILTHRSNGTTGGTTVRGVWDTSNVGAGVSHNPGEPYLAHSDWAWHAGTANDIFVGAQRPIRTRTGGVTTDHTAHGSLFGELHLQVIRHQVTALGDVEIYAADYNDGSGSQAHIYRFKLSDYGIGGTSPFSGNNIWALVRDARKFAGHRNRLNIAGAEAALAAFSPHPQPSPNGEWLLWQSSSQTSVAGFTYPVGTCGPQGGVRTDSVLGPDGYLALDIYLARTT
ncbi:MAG: TolB family protein [Candidatus Neomicrothrix subdominans]